MSKKQLIGTVISTKMAKTAVVRVTRVKQHPLYKRYYRVHKNYKVDDPKSEAKVGDVVLIEECRPISKEKHWRIIKKI